MLSAKVIGVMPGTQETDRLSKYDIKLTKTLKGAKRLFTAVYTGPNSAACGVPLTKGVEYLLMGRLHANASLHIHLCDFHEPWNDLSITRKHLTCRTATQDGCDCTIKSCVSFPCCMTSLTECLWTHFLPGKLGNRDQAQNYACVKKSDSCCAWDRPAIYPPNGYPALKG